MHSMKRLSDSFKGKLLIISGLLLIRFKNILLYHFYLGTLYQTSWLYKLNLVHIPSEIYIQNVNDSIDAVGFILALWGLCILYLKDKKTF